MKTLLTPIADSWSFAQKQRALQQSAFWLILLPTFAFMQLERLLMMQTSICNGEPGEIQDCAGNVFSMLPPNLQVMFFLLGLGAVILIVWGILSVLVVSERLLRASSGRSRSSFKAVAGEARALVIPFIVTSILRTIFQMLWSLLLIIPGVIYSTRTVFYPVIMISEGLSYKAALDRSKEVVKGRTWDVFFAIIFFVIVFFLPLKLVDVVLKLLTIPPTPWLAQFVADLVHSTASTTAFVLFFVTLTRYYKDLLPKKAQSGKVGKAKTSKPRTKKK